MKPAHVKMWAVWLVELETRAQARIYGSPDPAEAARADAAHGWRHLGWRKFPMAFEVQMDHTSDGAPVDPKRYEVVVHVHQVPDFIIIAAPKVIRT